MTEPVPHHESPEDEGIPDLQEASGEDLSTGDGQGELLPPRDHPQAAEEHGTTALEQRTGESLDERLSREQPEESPGGERESAGRLVAPGGDMAPDETSEEVATDAGHDSGGFSAEEAAMHIEEER